MGGSFVELHLATLVGVMGVVTIVAVYFFWVRKLGQKKEPSPPAAP
jgi:hypothetical protein